MGTALKGAVMTATRVTFASTTVLGAQPVRVPLPPLVLVGSVRVEGTLAGCVSLLPLFCAFQREGACVQQRLLERQELLFLPYTHIAGAQPVPVPLPTVVN